MSNAGHGRMMKSGLTGYLAQREFAYIFVPHQRNTLNYALVIAVGQNNMADRAHWPQKERGM
jgi:hypothetical protein